MSLSRIVTSGVIVWHETVGGKLRARESSTPVVNKYDLTFSYSYGYGYAKEREGCFCSDGAQEGSEGSVRRGGDHVINEPVQRTLWEELHEKGRIREVRDNYYSEYNLEIGVSMT